MNNKKLISITSIYLRSSLKFSTISRVEALRIRLAEEDKAKAISGDVVVKTKGSKKNLPKPSWLKAVRILNLILINSIINC